jgi:hypothetical protein
MLIFVFCLLTFANLIYRFFKAVLSTPPQQLKLTNLETILYGVALSYVITYLNYVI